MKTTLLAAVAAFVLTTPAFAQGDMRAAGNDTGKALPTPADYIASHVACGPADTACKQGRLAMIERAKSPDFINNRASWRQDPVTRKWRLTTAP